MADFMVSQDHLAKIVTLLGQSTPTMPDALGSSFVGDQVREIFEGWVHTQTEALKSLSTSSSSPSVTHLREDIESVIQATDDIDQSLTRQLGD